MSGGESGKNDAHGQNCTRRTTERAALFLVKSTRGALSSSVSPLPWAGITARRMARYRKLSGVRPQKDCRRRSAAEDRAGLRDPFVAAAQQHGVRETQQRRCCVLQAAGSFRLLRKKIGGTAARSSNRFGCSRGRLHSMTFRRELSQTNVGRGTSWNSTSFIYLSLSILRSIYTKYISLQHRISSFDDSSNTSWGRGCPPTPATLPPRATLD